jgi:4,4'-diaponeurosporenoate glycosyltransferase
MSGAADVVAFAVLWSIGWALLFRVRVPAPAEAGRPPLSVIVPARDEERSLPHLLRSLRDELRPGDEVLVVDDHSGDDTVAVATAGGAVVVPAPPLPPGWTGKTWSCHTGVGHATGDTLLFLDADTWCEPGGLGRVAALLDDRGGLVSVQPFHVVPRPVERLAAFFNLVGMMGTGAFTAAADRVAPRGAFGPCLLTTAADYRRVGGHEAVRGSVLDDLALSDRYRLAGLPVHLRAGRGSVAYRMYPDGLRSLVEGFTKNLAGGARAVGPLRSLLVAGWLAACTAPIVLVTSLPPMAALVGYALVALQVHVHLRRIGSFGPMTAVLYAVPLLVFLAVFCRSLVLTGLRRRVSWKGRRLPTRSRPGTPRPGSSAAPRRSP